MTVYKTDKNRMGKRIQRETSANGKVDTGRSHAELNRLSATGNVRQEKAWPTPSYNTFVRNTLTVADTVSPATTGPDDSACFNLDGYSGLHGYAAFTGGTSPSVDLELWAKDQDNNAWFLVASEPSVNANEEFRFPEGARSRKVFLRVAAIGGSPTNVSLRCSPE